MHWIVQDSEDEGEYSALPLPTHSSISDFSTSEILLPTANKTSAFSDFTANDSSKFSNATTDSVVDASISSAPVAKPKPPKPRPAYGRVLVADSSIASSSISAASITANAINRISPGSLDGPGLGTAVSMERTDTHKRSATTDASPAKSGRSPNGHRRVDAVVEGSSKDFIVLMSSDVEEEAIASEQRSGSRRKHPSPDSRSLTTSHVHGSSAQSPFGQSSSSVHATWDPPLGEGPVNTHGTLPSSPFVPQRKKRRVTDWNSDLEDSIQVEDKGSTTNEGSTAKKQKRSKEQKPRERKGKGKPASEGAIGSVATTSSTKPKKRESKKKEKAIEQEFKSREYVEDSDDELLLEPKSSKTASRTSPSDPASANASVNASIDISVEPSAFAPTKTAAASSSIPPSSSATVQASAGVSELPSADIPAPPPSPCVLASESSRPRSEKRKRKRTKPVGVGKDEIPGSKKREAASASLHRTGGAIVEPQELTKGEKHSKKGKAVEPPVSPADTENQGGLPDLDDFGSAEKGVPETGKSRPNVRKERKKRGTIVSSDEDEMEAENTRNTESRDNNKENEPLSSPKNPSAKMPGLPSGHALSSNQKLQTTPKMPSRRDSMSALIRRASAKVQSPLSTPSPVYSPLAKVSRTVLSHIAPLHPNRRTPPAPPPRPPPPKKSKKMLELEEKWEEELAETVEGWSCMTDEERASLRRAKRDEYFGCED